MSANEVIAEALRRRIAMLKAKLVERHVHQCPACGLPWIHVPPPEIGRCLYIGAAKCGTCAERSIGATA